MKSLFTFVFLAITATTFVHGQFLSFQNFNHKDGLNSASINCITQTPDGYIWLGTDGAELVRYDGYNFNEITFKNGENHHHFNSFYQDGDQILFASLYRGFYSYSTRNQTIVKLNEEKLFFGQSIDVFRKDSVYYFVGTHGILYRKGRIYGSLFTKPQNQNNIEVHHRIETEHAVFLFTNAGNFRLKEGKLTPLNALLPPKIKNLSAFRVGYIERSKLYLYSENLNKIIVADINEKDEFSNVQLHQVSSKPQTELPIISFFYNSRLKKAVALSSSGQVYEVNKLNIRSVQHNYNGPLLSAKEIMIDFNGDYWVTSQTKGLFKISNDLFTKIQSNALFESPSIFSIYQTRDNKFILSKDKEKSFIGKLKDSESFNELPFPIFSVASFGQHYLLGTDRGVLEFDSKSETFKTAYFPEKTINLVFVHEKTIYVGVADEGLYRINSDNKQIEQIESQLGSDYFYAAQINTKTNEMFFGTNYCIMRLKPNSNKAELIDLDYQKLGSYSGISTKDKYGTVWFTLDNALIGITDKNKTVTLLGSTYLNSNILYTLNSDLKGNLIVGTNKGIIILKVNALGEVLSSKHFSGVDGFLGYETNMRSQFQLGNLIYVGTVEGLFQINTDKLNLNSIPPPPFISKSNKENLAKALGDNSVSFNLRTNNSKSKEIRYEYRLRGINDTWEKTDDANLIINDLDNGVYTLEVRSSFDGIHYSKISSFQFEIKSPFWKSSWFLLALIVSVILINVLLILYYKSHESSTLVSSKDVDVHLQIAPTIILFATITTPLAILFAPLADSSLQYHYGVAFSLGFGLLGLYFLSLIARTTMREHLFGLYLKIGLSIVLLVFFWETYNSALNPYYIMGILLTSTMAPYIFNRIILTVALAIAIFLLAIGTTILLDVTVFPKMHFLIAIFFMSCLLIFSSYLRFDSLEKLIFISGIINKGNVPAIAFNKQGVVTYASENVSSFIPMRYNELLNNNISILNQFVPQGAEEKPKDITKEFKDGEKYLVPMEDHAGNIRWIEWAYKDFTRDIKVILGQDVSEKVELENTYELLVESAEDFIYRCDANGKYVFVNNVSYHKLGYTKEDLLGVNSISIVQDEYQEEVRQYYRDHLQSLRHSSYKELPIKKKNGEILWIGQSLTTIFSVGTNRQVTGFIALARDITNIRAQQEIIREQRDSITSSINYARRIQYNLLPQENLFQNNFKEHFIFSKPKDIVSGDFYWMNQIEKSTVLVLADCTGHGVPGSFMTLLGYNLLNSIVLEGRTVDPSKILNELDQKLVEYLPRGEGDTTVIDGMEVTICVFENNTNKMSYACAGSRFLIYENNAFTMFKGDNKHIGDFEPDFNGYNTYFKEFLGDFNLFLFTDGFQDQFGGAKDKKYSFRRLLELFEASIDLPLEEQGRIIEQEFNHWIGDNQQTDDVSILSVTREIINFDEHEDLS